MGRGLPVSWPGPASAPTYGQRDRRGNPSHIVTKTKVVILHASDSFLIHQEGFSQMTYIESKAEASAGRARIVWKGGFAYFVGLAILIAACSVTILSALHRSESAIVDLKKDVANLHREVEIASREHATELQRIRRFVEEFAKKNKATEGKPEATSVSKDTTMLLTSNLEFTRPFVDPTNAFELQYWICQDGICSVVLRTDREQYDIFFCHNAAYACDVIRGFPKNTWFKWEHDEISVWALASHNHSGNFHKVPLAKRKTGVKELLLHD
jgi:hypothetical protein